MRFALTLALLASSCGLYPEPVPPGPDAGDTCVTACGVAVPWLTAQTQGCDQATVAEANALLAARAHAGQPVDEACRALAGWTVAVGDGGAWLVEEPTGPLRVAGVTDCARRTMTVNSRNWAFNSYAHERFHAHDCPSTNAAHLGWPDGGTCAAIAAAHVAMGGSAEPDEACR